MLKRIFIIALITGIAQVFVVFALKYISQNSSPEQVKAIGQIDSLLIFIMNVIAFGLQPAAMRDLALTDNWKQDYLNTQSARLTLSLFVACFALFAFADSYYLVFLFAPLLALSGDYALYARGRPVIGSIIALLRSAIPFLLLILFERFEKLSLIYLIGLMIIYIITDIAIALFLKVRVIPVIQLKSLARYMKTFSLGLVSISLYFIGLGVILIASYFYNGEAIAVAFIGLKFYVIYKGLLRVLHQAFIKDMTNELVCLKIDQLSSIAGIIFFGSLTIFPGSFIKFFFGAVYTDHKSFFILLGIAGFIYSAFLSMATRSMLMKLDNPYMKITVFAAAITLLSSIILSFFDNNPLSIGISILAGELFWMIALIKIAANTKDIKDRIAFNSQIFFLLIIPVIIRYIAGDVLLYYFISFGSLGLLLLFLHYNKFKSYP